MFAVRGKGSLVNCGESREPAQSCEAGACSLPSRWGEDRLTPGLWEPCTPTGQCRCTVSFHLCLHQKSQKSIWLMHTQYNKRKGMKYDKSLPACTRWRGHVPQFLECCSHSYLLPAYVLQAWECEYLLASCLVFVLFMVILPFRKRRQLFHPQVLVES